MVDALVLCLFQKTDSIRNCRNVIDWALSKIPPFRDVLRFQSGLWESHNGNNATGGETLALLAQYPFALVEDCNLIPNKSTRKRVLNL